MKKELLLDSETFTWQIAATVVTHVETITAPSHWIATCCAETTIILNIQLNSGVRLQRLRVGKTKNLSEDYRQTLRYAKRVPTSLPPLYPSILLDVETLYIAILSTAWVLYMLLLSAYKDSKVNLYEWQITNYGVFTHFSCIRICKIR